MSSNQKASNIISLPKGGGAQRGIGEKFSPDLHTGTGNFTVPIALPSGRNGFQPQLNLVYSTGNGNGPFGLGWSLSIPGIARKSSHGIPRYLDRSSKPEDWDTFILSGVEDLVPVRNPDDPGKFRYRPRTEGLFAQIEHYSSDGADHWQVKSKDGLISKYGLPASTPHEAAIIYDPTDDPSHPTRIFAWKLTLTEDPFGNRIEYEYDRDLAEEGPHHWNQLYLKHIRYADYTDNGATKFLVNITFNYEDRPDVYSEYRSGFEIRTRRRCQSIKVQTRPADSNLLVRTYKFGYAEDADSGARLLPLNRLSLLTNITVTGHDGDKTEALPPLQFTYSAFEPGARKFFPIQGADLPPHSLGHPDYELIDLVGNGLTDVLEMNGTVRYWRNLGGGRFDRPRLMEIAPAGVRLAEAGTQILDANGDGRADLVVTQGALTGYYPLGFRGQWGRFQAYGSPAPSFNLEDPEVKLLDLTGDGVTDVIRSGTSFECFFNDPKQGWRPPQLIPRRALEKFPNVNFSDSRVKWADMTGDGLQDIVLIHSGNIAYWPNLGYGQWGKRIQMKRAPGLPANYDPKRVLLGDIDGDGCADLIYVDDGTVTLWMNQSGNSWSEAIPIRGTPSVTDMDSVRLIDFLGSGVSGILWSRDANLLNRHSMFFLDLTGGTKPYLLTKMENNMGALTNVTYVSSTRFFVADEATARTRWRTPLPFPVQVVARVEVDDQFSGSKLTSEYSYHHGYWDGAEREFRGFGRVDQRDAEEFQREGSVHFSAPTLTKTWFHHGPVGEEYGDWEEMDWSSEYWEDDLPLLNHKKEIDDRLGEIGQRYAKRDALRTLRGKILRTEMYALEGPEDDPRRKDRPYTVTEYVYSLREEAQPIPEEAERLRIFFPFLLCQRTTQWERGDVRSDPPVADPMTQLSFSDSYDEFGQSRWQTTVALPRRQAKRQKADGGLEADQKGVLATHTRTEYANPMVNTNVYLHDRVAQVRTFELRNPPGVTESLPDNIAQVLQDQADAARAFHEHFRELLTSWAPGQRVADPLRLIAHTINHYDGDAFEGLLAGEVGLYGALTRTESLIFADTERDKTLNQAYGDQRPSYLDGQSGSLPPGAPPGFGSNIGYRKETDDPKGYHAGYYVNIDRRKFDFQDAALQQKSGLVVASQDALGHQTTIMPDSYWLLPVEATDPVGLKTKAEYSYRVLQPNMVTDPNGNSTTYTYTPLGLLENTFIRGKDGEGDQSKPGVRIEYDFMAFANRRQPVSVRTIQRVEHESSNTLTTMEYSDGFGRLLQTRTQAEDEIFGKDTFGGDVLPANQADPNTAQPVAGSKNPDPDKPNVVVSGWQVYDNKGRVVEKYEPFFDRGWEYGSQQDAPLGQKVIMFYDPRGQLIRTLNPDGSEQRVIFGVPSDLSDPEHFAPTTWETYTYDSNDNAGRTHPAQSEGYKHHWNTPTSRLVDALGRTLMSVERNRVPTDSLPSIQEYLTRSTYDIQGNVLTVTDALGRQAFRYIYDLAKRPLRTESIDAGWRFTVFDAIGNPVEARDEKGAILLHEYDQGNRATRLWASDGTDQPFTLREKQIYGGTQEAVADGLRDDQAKAANLLGSLYKHYDEAGLLTFERYDFKGNLLEKVRQVIKPTTILSVFNPAPIDWKVKAYRVNWGQSDSEAVLDPTPYQSSMTYDALNRMKTMKYPSNVTGERKLLRPRYNKAGALEGVVLDDNEYVNRIAYNAKGQRVLIVYGNGMMTRYAYDQQTFRLVRLRTERYTSAEDLKYQPTGAPLQDFSYEYDLAGNVTRIKDRIPGCGIRNSPQGHDALDRLFEYDPLYRLTSATGREASSFPKPRPWPDRDEGSSSGYNSPNHGTPNQDNAPDLTVSYWERYEYDPAGNMLAMKHGNGVPSWTRHFGMANFTPKEWREKVIAYMETGAAVPEVGGNRLTNYGNDENKGKTHEYDANGNLNHEFENRRFEWDHNNRLRVFRNQAGTSEPTVHVHYLYDAEGERVMKVVRKQGGEYEVTVYIDGMFEHHQWELTSPSPKQNNLLHVRDNQSRISLIRIGDKHHDDAGPGVQFHLGDHLSSSNLVVDETGNWINREELFPYGETSFGSFAKKRYRFTGKERDEESGLNHHGERYYASWISRWISCDPGGTVDGTSVYLYCKNNPTTRIDIGGRQSHDVEVGNFTREDATLIHTDTVRDLISQGKSLGEAAAIADQHTEMVTGLDMGMRTGQELARNVSEYTRQFAKEAVQEAAIQAVSMGAGGLVVRGLARAGLGSTFIRGAIGGVASQATSDVLHRERSAAVDYAISGLLGAGLHRILKEPKTLGSLNIPGKEMPKFMTEAAPKIPADKSTIPLQQAGESHMSHGTRAHQEFPRIIKERHPGAHGQFNVAPGLKGPDLGSPTGMNATYAEMKSLWGRQAPMLRQAENWGLDPQTGRYFFYDRKTGLVFEGIIQTEKFPSGKFRP